MATASTKPARKIEYPTSDGKPMAETDWHRELMLEAIETLKFWFKANSSVYVSGNLLVFYEEGNKRKHVAPDVFVVRGVSSKNRPNYLIWAEGRGPEAVIELTSKTTRKEDTSKKLALYRDVMKVQEYFMFDPRAEYLDPPMQGFCLVDGAYVPMEPVNGRLPSEVLGLHLERVGTELRFWNPATGQRVPTPNERIEQNAKVLESVERKQQQAEEEIARLRAQLAAQNRPTPSKE